MMNGGGLPKGSSNRGRYKQLEAALSLVYLDLERLPESSILFEEMLPESEFHSGPRLAE